MANEERKIEFFKLILKPFKDVNFKNLIMFLCSWNFAVNLSPDQESVLITFTQHLLGGE